MPRRASLLLSFMLILISSTTPVYGQLQWDARSLVSPEGSAVAFPKAGIDAAGNATLIWMGLDTTSSSYLTPPWQIRLATREAGGTWALANSPLSAPKAFSPVLAVAENGAAVAAWALVETQELVQAVARQSGGQFGAVTTLTGIGQEGAGDISAALDAGGTGGLAWESDYGSSNQLNIWLVSGGVLLNEKSVISSGRTTFPATFRAPCLVAGASGVYVSFDQYIWPTTWPSLIGPNSGNSFSAPSVLPPEDSSGTNRPVIAALPDGTIAAVWSGGGTTPRLYAKVGTEAPQAISAEGSSAANHTLGAGPDGTLVAAWVQNDGSFTYRLYAAVRRANETAFSAPQALSQTSSESLDSPGIAFAGNLAIVVWSRKEATYFRIEASYLPQNGSFSAEADRLSAMFAGYDGHAHDPSIAANSDGKAILAWKQSVGGYYRVLVTDTGFEPAVPTPTATPSSTPTATPSSTPTTVLPTIEPPVATSTPTVLPTVVPTIESTIVPTAGPTEHPTVSPDTIPPRGALKINKGAKKTKSVKVTLNISLSDDKTAAAGITMRFSNNKMKWSPLQPYITKKVWNLSDKKFGGSAKPGTRRVYLQAYDAAGNQFSCSASISYQR